MLEWLGTVLPPEAVLALVLGAVVLVLALVAALHPLVSLAMGLVLIAVPVVQVVFFDRRYFHSDGSAAGLVLFFFYAAFGFVCATLGLAFAGQGVANLARGKGRRVLPGGAAAVVALSIVVAAAALPAWFLRDKAAAEHAARTRPAAADQQAVREVAVRDHYQLEWRWRLGARRLELRVPAADIAWRGSGRDPSVSVTSDGPRSLELTLAGMGRPDAQLTLHRDDSTLEPALARDLEAARPPGEPNAPGAFWVDISGGGWKLLGMACDERYRATGCHEPEAPLARHVPFVHGLDQVRLHADRDRSRGRGCVMAFHYRGRPVTLSSPGDCHGGESLAMLAAAAALLDRLGRETAAPPSERALAERLDAEATRCEEAVRAARQPAAKAGAIDAARGICEYAVRSASLHAANAPSARASMLRALEAQLRFGIGITAHLPELDAFLAARAAAGQGESREALWGHALRAWNFAGSTAEEAKRATRASLDAILAPAPRVLAADDRVFDAVYSAVSRAAVDETLRPRLIELLKAWDAKAAAAPGSDLALRVRYLLCRERLSAGLERETLGACADELTTAWQRRATEGKPFALFDNEAELVMAIARMRVSHAWATNDFANGAERVRRVREQAAARFPAGPEYDPMLSLMEQMQTELEAKGRGGR